LSNKSQSNNNIQPANKTSQTKQPRFFELKDGLEYFSSSNNKNTTQEILKRESLKKLPLINRLEYTNQQGTTNGKEDEIVFRSDSFGNKQMTFVSRKAKREKDWERKAQEHHLERKQLRRSAGNITKTFKKSQSFFKK
jgi:hypothetical protein